MPANLEVATRVAAERNQASEAETRNLGVGDGCFADGADHTFVYNEQHGTGTTGVQSVQTAAHACDEVRPFLAPGIVESRGTGLPILEEHGIAGLNLLGGEPLPAPEVDLAEVGFEAHGGAAGENAGRFPRTAQRTRHDEIEDLSAKLIPGGANLIASLIGKLDVGASVETDARVAGGFPVPNEDETAQR